jgi:competence protein ComEA
MPTKAERTALVFLSAVILGGGVVRLVRAVHGGLRPAPAAATALARQKRAADSMARATSPHGPAASARGRRGGTRGHDPEVAPPTPSFPIDVDRATAKELEALPRIGPALATRIVSEREARGIFGSLDALDQRVRGIGPAMASALRPFVTFSGR